MDSDSLPPCTSNRMVLILKSFAHNFPLKNLKLAQPPSGTSPRFFEFTLGAFFALPFFCMDIPNHVDYDCYFFPFLPNAPRFPACFQKDVQQETKCKSEKPGPIASNITRLFTERSTESHFVCFFCSFCFLCVCHQGTTRSFALYLVEEF